MLNNCILKKINSIKSQLVRLQQQQYQVKTRNRILLASIKLENSSTANICASKPLYDSNGNYLKTICSSNLGHNLERTFTEAKAMCQSAGMQLAKSDAAGALQQFSYDQYPNAGLLWVDFTPDSNAECPCLVANNEADYNCSFVLAYYCEYDGEISLKLKVLLMFSVLVFKFSRFCTTK